MASEDKHPTLTCCNCKVSFSTAANRKHSADVTKEVMFLLFLHLFLVWRKKCAAWKTDFSFTLTNAEKAAGMAHLKMVKAKVSCFARERWQNLLYHFKYFSLKKIRFFRLKFDTKRSFISFNSWTISHIRGRCCTTSLLDIRLHLLRHVFPSKTPSHHLQQAGNGLKSKCWVFLNSKLDHDCSFHLWSHFSPRHPCSGWLSS